MRPSRTRRPRRHHRGGRADRGPAHRRTGCRRGHRPARADHRLGRRATRSTCTSARPAPRRVHGRLRPLPRRRRATAAAPGAGDPHHQRLRRLQGRPGRPRAGVRQARLRRAVLHRPRLRRLRLQDHAWTTPTTTARRPSSWSTYLGGGEAGQRRQPGRLRPHGRRGRTTACGAGTTRGSAWSAAPTAVRCSSRSPASTRGSTRSSRSSPGTTCPTPWHRTTPTSRRRPARRALRHPGHARRSAGPACSSASASPTASSTRAPTRPATSAAPTSSTRPARPRRRWTRSATRPQDTSTFARHASVSSYVDRIRIPTLLMQGENDTLFNLQEAAATYRALQAQGTPVKMVWQSWGHSGGGTPAPGELDMAPPGAELRGPAGDPLVRTTTSKDARRSHRSASSPTSATGSPTPASPRPRTARRRRYPVGATQDLLPVRQRRPRHRQRRRSRRAARPTPTPPARRRQLTARSPRCRATPVPDGVTPPYDTPGTFASWTTAPLAAPVVSVGVPRLTLRLSSPVAEQTQAAGPAGQLLLFAKIYDVAPDGSKTLVNRLVSPTRVADVTRPVHIELPGVVHRYAAGHRLSGWCWRPPTRPTATTRWCRRSRCSPRRGPGSAAPAGAGRLSGAA